MQAVMIAVETDEATSIQLREDLAKVTDEDIFVQKREGLGGMVADFITVLQAASPIRRGCPAIRDRARPATVIATCRSAGRWRRAWCAIPAHLAHACRPR